MRLTVPRALMLALIANLIPGCERSYADRQEAAAAAGGTAPPSGPADAAPPKTAQDSSPR